MHLIMNRFQIIAGICLTNFQVGFIFPESLVCSRAEFSSSGCTLVTSQAHQPNYEGSNYD